MSWNLARNIIRPLQQWYSEINSATLTGAIDVIVVEQEDGSFVSSPFHVRFGKLGVLKAREKIVDIEVNGEPVDIHMKLDEFGTAFFVEGLLSDEEDGDIGDGATSPIQGLQSGEEEEDEIASATVNTASSDNNNKGGGFEKGGEKGEKEISDLDLALLASGGSVKGRYVRKKRKKSRRQRDIGRARSSSHASLRELEGLAADADADADADASEDDRIFLKPGQEGDVPRRLSASRSTGDLQQAEGEEGKAEDQTDDASASLARPATEFGGRRPSLLLLSRLGGEAAIDSFLTSQEQLGKEKERQQERQQQQPDFNYYSEPDLSPAGSRSGSPVMSDSELEKQKTPIATQQQQQNWEWGQLPSNTTAAPGGADDKGPASPSSSWRLPIFSVGEQEQQQQKEQKQQQQQHQDKAQRKLSHGVYLEDIQDDEEMLSIYVGNTRESSKSPGPAAAAAAAPEAGGEEHRGGEEEGKDADEDAESGNGSSPPVSPHSVEGGRGKRPRYISGSEDSLLPDVAISLCGGLSSGKGDEKEVSPALFDRAALSYDDFLARLRGDGGSDLLLADPDLVVRVGGDQYLSWGEAAPAILAAVLYGRELPPDLTAKRTQKALGGEDQAAKTSSRSWWPFRSRRAAEKKSDDITPTQQQQEEGKSEEAVPRVVEPVSSEGEADADVLKPRAEGMPRFKKYKKSLRLSSKDIEQLCLQPGPNEVQFSITTAYQGTSRCCCHIYWWKSTDKLVISDIDGTITKSDVLGYVLPIIGQDWAQSGVASLFTKIVDNGYNIMYLSARAIGQAAVTKDYLKSITQGQVNLPDGPLFLNPTSLVNAFHREVIEKKPEQFKIACLKDIQSLYPRGRNPFYAGYGNKDVFAYRSVGVPLSRIFTINHRGELKHELTQTFQTSYDLQGSMVDHIFPPVSRPLGEDESPTAAQQEFSSFAFWREPLPEVDTLGEEKQGGESGKSG